MTVVPLTITHSLHIFMLLSIYCEYLS